MIACLDLVLILLGLLVGCALGYRNTDETQCGLSVRIKELGDKSNLLLVFLSFAFVAAVTLQSGEKTITDGQRHALTIAMRCWVSAIFPVVVGIVPVKEFGGNNPRRWYSIVRWCKFWLLWLAIAYIVIGAIEFYRAVHD